MGEGGGGFPRQDEGVRVGGGGEGGLVGGGGGEPLLISPWGLWKFFVSTLETDCPSCRGLRQAVNSGNDFRQ